MSSLDIIIGLVALLNLSLGVIVYWKGKRSYPALCFSLLAYSLVAWCVFIIGYRMTNVISQLTIWTRLLYGGAFLISIAFFYFATIFPVAHKIKKFIIILTIVSSLFFLWVTIFTDYVVKTMTISNGDKIASFGPAYPLYFIFIIGFFVAAFYSLVKSFKTSKGIIRTQVYYVFFGTLLAGIISITSNLILPTFGYVRANWVGPVSMVIMAIFIAYAILRYHLMNIRVILTEFLVGIISLVLLSQFFTSKNNLDYVWNGLLFIAFLFLGISLIKNVTKEIQRRQELQRLYQQVNALSKMKSEFLSIVSHQLRTPLTAMKGYISMMKEATYGKPPERMEKPLQNIYASSERLIRLVNNLLKVTAIESGKIEMNPQKASLEEIIVSLVDEMEHEAADKKLYLKFEKPRKSLPEMMIDRDEIRQAILNIIDNAIKYTNSGGVTVKTEIAGKKVRVAVMDTGEGMTEKEIENIFQSFSRGPTGTRFWAEGSGLGLYTAKKFAEMHDGKVWAESKGKGKGSTFYIELPLMKNYR